MNITYKIILSLLLMVLLGTSVRLLEDDFDPSLKQVKVQLKWIHQFQFAGFYAAIEKGYFEELGLDVELIEGSPSIGVTETVINGQADFGIGNSSLLIDFNNGLNVVAIAALFQHSPSIILARRDKNIRTINDLEGHTLMGKIHTAELMTYLKTAGVDLNKINLVPHTGTFESLKNLTPNGVDATTAYVSTGPFLASQLNISYRIFNPRDINIDFYGDTLFTSNNFAIKNPDLVIAMRNGLIRGWQYALKNSDELVTLILEKYNPKKDRPALEFEAKAIIPLFASDLVDMGFMNYRRWREIGNTFSQAGTLKEDYILDGFLFETKESLPSWAYTALVAGVVFFTIITFIILYILRFNRMLSLSLIQIKKQKEIIEYQAMHDTLTGLPGIKLLRKRWGNAVTRSDRDKSRTAIFFIDLDGFKSVNDTFGHHVGDRVLQIVSEKLKNSIRSADTAARFGGDEFVVILDHIKNHEDARLIAKKIIKVISQEINYDNNIIYVGASIGIAIYPDDSSNPEDIISLADSAMYKAKNNGKNNFIFASSRNIASQ
jgi:diguanylate cyclase (GGDEF)-like protein